MVCSEGENKKLCFKNGQMLKRERNISELQKNLRKVKKPKAMLNLSDEYYHKIESNDPIRRTNYPSTLYDLEVY